MCPNIRQAVAVGLQKNMCRGAAHKGQELQNCARRLVLYIGMLRAKVTHSLTFNALVNITGN